MAHLERDSTETDFQLIAAVIDAYHDAELAGLKHMDKDESAVNNEDEGGERL